MDTLQELNKYLIPDLTEIVWSYGNPFIDNKSKMNKDYKQFITQTIAISKEIYQEYDENDEYYSCDFAIVCNKCYDGFLNYNIKYFMLDDDNDKIYKCKKCRNAPYIPPEEITQTFTLPAGTNLRYFFQNIQGLSPFIQSIEIG